ncbi:sensor domain-containing diguanylate cyclase [Erythrobacter sp. F6033]|uniref:GGDEF domain-containing protein n=1 Tax=Erythrobacter sp. F6033 TaxID=2926401 RepID=UPI001FF0EED4|nr:sensor domain-containing diguanylate cyclase [Erythrobacter sp. F6033]MCK0127946.1 sensor domain-containing diguanylate cyclase [Erythrobacter sp. F6033]
MFFAAIFASNPYPALASVDAFTVDGLFVGQLIGSDILLAACAVLIGLLMAAFAGLWVMRRKARTLLQISDRRARYLANIMQTAAMVEDMAGIGVWQFDPDTGIQQWSKGMRRQFGIHHDDPFVEGDAETLLFANNVDLIGAVSDKLGQKDRYDLHFDIYGFDGVSRTLCVQAENQHGPGGIVTRVVAVIRDVTAQIERERELEVSRAEAVRQADRAIKLAETDPLTGLANRRRVMDQLDRMIVDARRASNPLMLIMFDIDHFKQVNDTFGHIEGDKVLKNVARIAEGESRNCDVIGRVGGEEFVWIVPNITVGIARVMSERLRQAVAANSATSTVPPVTVSAGFAELGAGDTSLSLFARADAALYEAKDAGRNRVRMAA